jgi:hypothetical protein
VHKVAHPFDEFVCDVRGHAASVVGRRAGELSVLEPTATDSLVDFVAVEGDG